MSTIYQVKVNDEIRTYEEGTSFEVIAKDFQHLYEPTSNTFLYNNLYSLTL